MSTDIGRHYQVVGVDGSPGAKRALAWAIARADRLGPVEPVSAWHYPWWAFVPTATGTMLPLNEEEFADVTTRLVELSLEGMDRRNVLDAVVVHGSAGEALLTVGGQASLIVVGTRGHGALASGLLGSVSANCASNATVPVAIIPGETSIEDEHNTVVVGYDGSEFAEDAIEWAARYTPSESVIKVVHAWSPTGTVTAQVSALASEQLSTESLTMVNEIIDSFQSRPEFAKRKFEAVSESGDAREILRTMSAEADLLVVGARGRGALAHLLLGSVSSSLSHHPLAATVIVR